MSQRFNEFFGRISKRWLTVFVLSSVSTLLYCFIGMPLAHGPESDLQGIGHVLIEIWGSGSFLAAVVSEYFLMKGYWLKAPNLSHAERMRSLLTGTIAGLLGMVAIFMFMGIVRNPSESTQIFTALLLLMVTGITVIGILGMVVVAAEHRIRARDRSNL